MQSRRLLPVFLFAAAMAYLEAAVVVYLRRLVGVVEPIRDPGLYDPFIAVVEIGREAATLVMLLALGLACGRSLQSRLGFAAFAFGVWDILYYVWLKVLLGWPASWLTPDILFLIPLPWWGPVLSPVLIACLAAAGGGAAVALDDRGRRVRPGPIHLGLFAAGVLAALFAFMEAAIGALPATAEGLARLRPAGFNWPVYLAGLLMMSAAVALPLRSAAAAAGAPR